ncbi:hypothetical protein BJI63_05605 [Acinetobacter baumannii]|nr:hypothetical protein BJI63_05605 [Acinetobacter baumannii]
MRCRGGNGGRDGRRFEGEGNFKRREGGRDDRPRRSFDDKPRGERPAFGGEDRPRREFNSDRPRREGGFEDRPNVASVVKIVRVASSTQIVHAVKVVLTISLVLIQMMTIVVTA